MERATMTVLPLTHQRYVTVGGPIGGCCGGGAGHMVIYDVEPDLKLEPNQMLIGRYLFTLPKPCLNLAIEPPHRVRFIYDDGTEDSFEIPPYEVHGEIEATREMADKEDQIEITVPLPDSFEPGPIEWRQVISLPVDVSRAALVPNERATFKARSDAEEK